MSSLSVKQFALLVLAGLILTAGFALAACGGAPQGEKVKSNGSAISDGVEVKDTLAGCSVTCICPGAHGASVSCSASGPDATCKLDIVDEDSGTCNGVSCEDDDGPVNPKCKPAADAGDPSALGG